MKINYTDICGFFLFLVPVPLFYDMGNFEFVYHYIGSFDPIRNRPLIPVPLGVFSLLFFIAAGYILSLAKPNKFRSVLSSSQILKFFMLVLFPLVIHATFISGLSLARVVQLILPMSFVAIFSFPVHLSDRRKLFRFIMLGGFGFFGAHFFSLLMNAEDLFSVDDKMEFSSFHGILIYQSLVSYPGVMSLYLFLVLAYLYISRESNLRLGYFFDKAVLLLPFLLLYLLAASGRRGFLVEFISAFIILTTFAFSFMLSMKKSKAWFLFSFLVFITIALSFFIFYFNSGLSLRVLSSIENNTFDSGRVDILSRAFAFFYDNLDILLFGAGGDGRVGFHNYVLDQVYRVGLPAFLFSYGAISILFIRVIRAFDHGTKFRFSRHAFSAVLLSNLFWQSMINASISQPYYFINFFMVSMILYFVLFSSEKTAIK